MEKSELEKTSALKLLSCLSEETKLLIYRDLNRPREERFVGKQGDLSMQDKARLKLLKAIRKEQTEQSDEGAKEPQENRMLD